MDTPSKQRAAVFYEIETRFRMCSHLQPQDGSHAKHAQPYLLTGMELHDNIYFGTFLFLSVFKFWLSWQKTTAYVYGYYEGYNMWTWHLFKYLFNIKLFLIYYFSINATDCINIFSCFFILGTNQLVLKAVRSLFCYSYRTLMCDVLEFFIREAFSIAHSTSTL